MDSESTQTDRAIESRPGGIQRGFSISGRGVEAFNNDGGYDRRSGHSQNSDSTVSVQLHQKKRRCHWREQRKGKTPSTAACVGSESTISQSTYEKGGGRQGFSIQSLQVLRSGENGVPHMTPIEPLDVRSGQQAERPGKRPQQRAAAMERPVGQDAKGVGQKKPRGSRGPRRGSMGLVGETESPLTSNSWYRTGDEKKKLKGPRMKRAATNKTSKKKTNPQGTTGTAGARTEPVQE
jgi:hypothetical protein